MIINSLVFYRLDFRSQKGRRTICQRGGRVNGVYFDKDRVRLYLRAVINEVPNDYEHEEW